MSASDAAILARWKPKLKIRQRLLERARRQLGYWKRRRVESAPGTPRRAQCDRMIADRTAKVAKREKQVADAKKVIARHSKPSLRERAFAEAVKLLWVREQGGNNRGPAVERIQRGAGGRPGDAWCGWFVSYVYELAGSRIHDAWQLGAVRLMDRAGLLRVRNPKRGHVVRYTFDHTGLFDTWIDRKTGRFYAIEGNTRDTGSASDAGGGEGVHRRERNIAQVGDFLRYPR